MSQSTSIDLGKETTPVAPAGRGATTILVLVCLAVFLTALDQTVVVTALKPIEDDILQGVPTTEALAPLSWVVSAYLLGYVIVMPLMGRVSDIYGRRRVLLAALGLFAIGSLMCADAALLGSLLPFDWMKFLSIPNTNPALAWLVLSRFLQAIGGGAVVPIAIAAIGDLFGARRRILALGIIGGVTEAGGALGPLYGALLVDHLHPQVPHYTQAWQWIFLLNVPFVVAVSVILLLLWPATDLSQSVADSVGTRIDWFGSALLGLSLLCISLGLGQQAGIANSFQDIQSSQPQNNPLLLGAAALLIIAFVFVENRQRGPLIPLDLFRAPAFASGAIYNLLMGAALIIALVDIPIFVLTAFSVTAYLDAGLALLRMTVMIPIGAFAGGWLVSRVGTRPIGVLGALCTATGFGLMHLWSIHTGWSEITYGTVIAGLGFGLIVAPVSTTALNTANADRFGVAASVVTASRMIGMIVGLALLSSWGIVRYQQLSVDVPQPTNVTDTAQLNAYAAALTKVAVHVVTDFFFIGAIISLIAVIPALFLWRPIRGQQGETATFSMGL